MTPLPKIPKPKSKPRRKLPSGLIYADYNYQMTSLQRLRWENKKRAPRVVQPVEPKKKEEDGDE